MWRAIRELAQDRNLDGNLVDTENNYEAIQMEIFIYQILLSDGEALTATVSPIGPTAEQMFVTLQRDLERRLHFGQACFCYWSGAKLVL